MEICGGGLYPHRYRHGEGFRNPSVYCDDLMRLITHVRRAGDQRPGRPQYGSISAVSLVPSWAALASGCSMVSVSSYRRSASSRSRSARA